MIIYEPPKEEKKKRRRTGYQLQQSNAEKVQRKKREAEAFILATEMWHKEKEKFKRQTALSIIQTINAAHGTNINERTVRRYVYQGNIGVPIVGRGKKCVLPKSILEALRSAIATHIQLSNAGMKKMPDRQYMIKQVELSLEDSVYKFKRYDHLYDRIMEAIADKISVNSGDFKMEQRRLIWTTYSNINIWFDTLKHFFIDKGFARVKT